MKKVILAGLILIFGSDCCALNILSKGGLPRISGKKAVAGMLATVILGGGPLELAMRRSGTFKRVENSLLKEYVFHHINDSRVDIGKGSTEIIRLDTNSKDEWEYYYNNLNNTKELSLKKESFKDDEFEGDEFEAGEKKLKLPIPCIIHPPARSDRIQGQTLLGQPGKHILFDYDTLHPYTYTQVSENEIMLGNKVIHDHLHTLIKKLAFDAIFNPTYPQIKSNGEVEYTALKYATNIVERNKKKLLEESGDAPIIVLFDNSLSRRGQGLDGGDFGLQQSESDPNLYEGKNHWGIALMSIRENMRVFYRQSWFKRRLNMISKVLFNISVL